MACGSHHQHFCILHKLCHLVANSYHKVSCLGNMCSKVVRSLGCRTPQGSSRFLTKLLKSLEKLLTLADGAKEVIVELIQRRLHQAHDVEPFLVLLLVVGLSDLLLSVLHKLLSTLFDEVLLDHSELRPGRALLLRLLSSIAIQL